jgi:hypothetical protein
MTSYSNLITLSTSNNQNINNTVTDTLNPLPRPLQLTLILQFFQHLHEINSNISLTLTAIWNYLIQHSLWKEQFQSFPQFRKAIHFNQDILPLLNKGKSSSRRSLALRETIYNNWSLYPEDALPDNISPPHFSEHFLRELAILSKHMPLYQAQSKLSAQLSARLSLAQGQNLEPVLKSIDVLNVHLQVRTIAQRKPRKGCSLYYFSDFSLELQEISDNSSDLSSEESVVSSFSSSSSQSIPQHQSKRSRCKCPSDFPHQLKGIHSKTSPEQKHQFLTFAMQYEPETFCRDHLRTFANNCLGLLTNFKTKVLMERVHYLYNNSNQLQYLHSLHSDWFQSHLRPPPPEKVPLGFKYLTSFIPEPIINSQNLFNRYCKSTSAWDSWIEDGNIIVSGFFQYLQPLINFIKVEFDLYQYHWQRDPSDRSLGFLRTMYYSLIQQLCRQDPAWYALQVAARPDHAWRLISYAYIGKAPHLDEKTGFVHFDIDCDQYMVDGTGGSLLSSSVSFLPESLSSCTVVVPGFHNHFKTWYHIWKRRSEISPSNVKTRSQSTGRTTNVTSEIYTRDDKRRFGEPVSVPCDQFAIRITLPTIIHGSTAIANSPRLVIFPWFTAIESDHHTLEKPGQLTWDELANCHLTLTPPSRDVNGRPLKFKVAKFPVAVRMSSTSPLCDALLGYRKWDDLEVQLERNIVLGPDEANAWEYIQQTRQRLVENYKLAWKNLEQLERTLYDTNSFFIKNEISFEQLLI